MKLRIISGEFKGRYLTLPDRRIKFRPTQQRVRQALVEIVKDRIPGAIAADVCAGSGAFGMELLSRGAQTVHFIEHDRLYGQTIAGYAKSLGVEERCRIFIEDARRFIERGDKVKLVVFFRLMKKASKLNSIRRMATNRFAARPQDCLRSCRPAAFYYMNMSTGPISPIARRRNPRNSVWKRAATAIRRLIYFSGADSIL